MPGQSRGGCDRPQRTAVTLQKSCAWITCYRPCGPQQNRRGCHGYPASYVMTSGCPACAGISVQLALESLSSFGWNQCPTCAGIRTWAHHGPAQLVQPRPGCLVATETQRATRRHPRLLDRAAPPANESVRPTESSNVVAAATFRSEPVVHLLERARVINAKDRSRIFHRAIVSFGGTWVKGIPNLG